MNGNDEESLRGYMKCLISDLNIWNDALGFDTAKVAELFAKYKKPNEISLIVDYCNEKSRHAEPEKWAYEAYRCATSGKIGEWLKHYVNGVDHVEEDDYEY